MTMTDGGGGSGGGGGGGNGPKTPPAPPIPGTIAGLMSARTPGDVAFQSLAAYGQFLGGVADAALGLLYIATPIHGIVETVNFLSDPGGYIAEKQAVSAAFWSDPGGFVGGAWNAVWSDVCANPAHALGYVAGEAAIVVGTAGVGALGAGGSVAAEAAEGVAVAAEGTATAAEGAGALSAAAKIPTVQFSASKAPGIAENFAEAVADGAPTTLTRVASKVAKANRRDALKTQERPGEGLSLDEYPFASSAEGGSGSWVKPVPIAEQNYQGGVLSRFYQMNSIRPGDPFRVEFIG